MNVFKRMGKPRTRGGRISRRGSRLFWVGFAGIFIGGIGAGAAHASGLVIGIVLAVTFGTAFAGLGIDVVGGRMINRDVAELDRKARAEAGEIPPWKPGDRNPLA